MENPNFEVGCFLSILVLVAVILFAYAYLK